MSFQAQCEEAILANSAPFSQFTDAGRAYLANWLARTAAVQSSSRLEMCEADEALATDLLGRMAFIGAHAARFGLKRQARQAASCEKPCFKIDFEDMARAKHVVSAASTILCPDIPNGG